MTEISTHRPTLSMAEAVERTGVSRSTIQRALKRGDIAGATRSEPDDPMSAWIIPIEGLIAAGWPPDAPGPALEDEQVIDLTDTPKTVSASQLAEAVHRAELAEQRVTAAELIAGERADRIADLQAALEVQRELIASTQRALEMSTSAPASPQLQPQPTVTSIKPTSDTPKQARGRIRRWLSGS